MLAADIPDPSASWHWIVSVHIFPYIDEVYGKIKINKFSLTTCLFWATVTNRSELDCLFCMYENGHLLVTLSYTITVLLVYMTFLSYAENQSDLKKGLNVI